VPLQDVGGLGQRGGFVELGLSLELGFQYVPENLSVRGAVFYEKDLHNYLE
jgi:hypothetical protein